MSRPHSYIKLGPKQRSEIESFMSQVISQEPSDYTARRRAQAVWYSAQGKSVQEICKRYGCAEWTVWSWFAAYRRHGVKGLLSRPVSKRLSQLQRDKLRYMKHLGKKHWTYARLVEWVMQNWGIKISPRRLQQILAHPVRD